MKKLICMLLTGLMMGNAVPGALAADRITAPGLEVISEEPGWMPALVEGETATREDLLASCAANGHSYDDWNTEYVQPTCTTPGYLQAKCQVCGALVKLGEEDPPAHDYENGACSCCGKEEPALVGITVDDVTVYDGLDNVGFDYDEATGGYVSYQVPYYFQHDAICEDNVHLHYADGTECRCSLAMLQGAVYQHDQPEDRPWELGVHPVVLQMDGLEAAFNVHVEPTPILRMEIDDVQIMEGMPIYPTGLVCPKPGVRIWFRDGSVFDSSDGALTETWDGMSGRHWVFNLCYRHRGTMPIVLEGPKDGTLAEAGKEYPVRLEYMGVECSFKFLGISDPVASLQIGDITLEAHEGGYWDFFETKTGRRVGYRHPVMESLDITVNYTDGTCAHAADFTARNGLLAYEEDLMKKLGWGVQLIVDGADRHPMDVCFLPGHTYTVHAKLYPLVGSWDKEHTCDFHITVKPLIGPFPDVDATAWYAGAVTYVKEHGLMNGTSGDTFEPETDMSRAMLAQVLYNMEGKPEDMVEGQYAQYFDDVDGKDWFFNAVRWANGNGIAFGYDNGYFGVNDPVTREQIAAILYRYADSRRANMTGAADLSAFPDGETVSDWAAPAVAWAVNAGFISGKGQTDGTVLLAPQGQGSRAEVASMLMRFVQNVLGPEEGPKHIHTYTVETTTEPSCTQVGSALHSCDCGYSFSSALPALGHSYSNGTCVRCGAKDPNYDQILDVDEAMRAGNDYARSLGMRNINYSLGWNDGYFPSWRERTTSQEELNQKARDATAWTIECLKAVDPEGWQNIGIRCFVQYLANNGYEIVIFYG